MTFKDFYLLAEGGNVFKNELATTRIDLSCVKNTVALISSILGYNVQNNLLGSTGKTPSSGDIDIAIDISQYSLADIRAKLTDWCTERNLPINDFVRATGGNLHFRCPIINSNNDTTDKFIQTDFMFVDDVNFAKFVFNTLDAPPLKGLHMQLVRAAIVKPMGLRWGNMTGLKTRDTGERVVENDPDKIARIVFQDNTAKGTDFQSVVNIIKFLKKSMSTEEVKQLLEPAEQTSMSTTNVSIYAHI